MAHEGEAWGGALLGGWGWRMGWIGLGGWGGRGGVGVGMGGVWVGWGGAGGEGRGVEGGHGDDFGD